MVCISINKFELKLANFLQENNKLNLNEGNDIFSKSPTSLKRNIININSYLPPEKHFIIEGNMILSKLTYKDYIRFVQSLLINDYICSQSERISLMIIYAFFDLSLNMTKLYQNIGVSLTTKKKDSKKLSDFIESRQLKIELLPKKGIKIIGEERDYRLLVTSILVPLLEIDSSDSLINRKANNPFEKMIFNYFHSKANEEINYSKEILTNYINRNNLRMSYSSKKFLYVYLSVTIFRNKHGFILGEELPINLKVPNYNLLDKTSENNFLNYLISSLDYSSKMPLLLDDNLKEVTDNFICDIQKNIITKYYSYVSLFEEVYCYLYKCMIRNILKYNFNDNKLVYSQNEFPKLFNIVSDNIETVEKNLDITFTHLQISTLTLIFRKFIMKNKVINRNSKKIVIVTNSTVEKTSFFIESLKHHLDVTIVGNININELYQLKNLNYDLIITFSNRIATLLEEKNYSCTKLNFYLHQDDIDNLLSLSFSSSSRRKILSEVFLAEISNRSTDEIRELLLGKYSSHFL